MASILFLWSFVFYLLKLTYSFAFHFIICPFISYVTVEWNTLKPSRSALSGTHKIVSYKIQNVVILKLTRHPTELGVLGSPSYIYMKLHTHLHYRGHEVSWYLCVFFFLMLWVLFVFFFFFWLFWVFIAVCGLSLVAASGATLCCGARASHCGGVPCCGARALGARA